MRQQGFSLIELMVVVAIIAILAALAIPAYGNYIARAQATEAMALMGGLKAAVSESFASTSTCPANGDGLIPTSSEITGKYVAKIDVGETASACTIIAEFKSAGISGGLAGKHVTFTLLSSTGSFVWTCTSDAEQRFLPKNCSQA